MKNRNIIAVPFSTDFHHCATTTKKINKKPLRPKICDWYWSYVLSKWHEAMFLRSGIIWLSEKRKKEKTMNFKLRYLQYE